VFLEGIMIECHENRYVFSTRIEHVIEFIRTRIRAMQGTAPSGREKDNNAEP
jgi:hypothetical protein